MLQKGRVWDKLVEHPAYEYRINLKKAGATTSMEHVCLLHLMNSFYPCSTNGFLVLINKAMEIVKQKLRPEARMASLTMMTMYAESSANMAMASSTARKSFEEQTQMSPEEIVQGIVWLEYNFIELFEVG